MKLSVHLKPKGEEEYYVFISLTHQSKRVLIATPYIIGTEHVKRGKIINRAKYAEIYNSEILKYEERLGRIVSPELLELNSIKEIITAERKDETTAIDFFAAADECIDKLKRTPARVRTADVYRYNLYSFKKYIGRNKLYTFEMTRRMMQGYVDALIKDGKKPSTILAKISHIKALFNAVKNEYNDYDNGVLNIKNDPFRKLEIPQVLLNAGDKSLSVADMRKIICADLKAGRGYRLSTVNYAYDYLLLSFYLLGINPIDLYNLTKSQYKDGRITYTRSKTKRRMGGAEISIPVCKQAAEIIDKHKGKGEWLLDLRDNYTQIEGAVKMMSNSLHHIYRQLSLEIEKDSFTWYSARHTWASIAANECHFSDAEVARALNHQSEHKVTRGYIRPDWSLLDRMNKAVLDVIFNQKAETDESAPA